MGQGVVIVQADAHETVCNPYHEKRDDDKNGFNTVVVQ
jgi:hypothetical protein